jgi:CheY-like chemotaxis protein
VILAVTAYARADEREHCLKAGMDDYLAKPFQAEQLIALVEKGTRLRRRRAPQHAAALIHAQSA